ncbi:unnamed protein product, partial [Brenthis ino]
MVTRRRQETSAKLSKKDLIIVGAPLNANRQDSLTQAVEAETDVIDLGAPQHARARRTQRLPRLYTPNPRLYPSTAQKSQQNTHLRANASQKRRRRFTRPVPNSRLYRPAPRAPPRPPPCRPGAWLAPVPRAALDTASHAALRLLRAAGGMAASKYSTSPDCSDGADASSAPSEFLAEFLSAIMRRQYAEALKYCQLILQYEPHNATAQGFYPLLRHKLHAHAKDETSSSDDTSSKRGGLFNTHFRQRSASKDKTEEEDEAEEEVEMEQGSSGSGSECSSLELDSSASPPPPAARAPRAARSDRSDPSDSTCSSSHTGSSWRWESGGERSERDDNGNPALCAEAAGSAPAAAAGDAENDNAASALHNAHIKSEAEASPLRQLRAHFACTINLRTPAAAAAALATLLVVLFV